MFPREMQAIATLPFCDRINEEPLISDGIPQENDKNLEIFLDTSGEWEYDSVVEFRALPDP